MTSAALKATVAFWAVYIAFLFPMRWPLSSPFELSFLTLGIAGAFVIIFTLVNRAARPAAIAVFALALAIYVWYWLHIAGAVRSHKPELGVTGFAARYLADVRDIFVQRIGNGDYWSAIRSVFYDAIAPVLVLLLTGWLAWGGGSNLTAGSTRRPQAAAGEPGR